MIEMDPICSGGHYQWGQCLPVGGQGKQGQSSEFPLVELSVCFPAVVTSEHKLQLGQPLKEATFSHDSGALPLFHALNFSS